MAILEYFYRAAVFEDFWHALWFLGPLNIGIAYFLFNAYPGAPSLMFAWGFHSVGNMLFRTLVAGVLLHEPIGLQQIAGMCMMFGGATLLK